ncbi:MAG: GNAT family N-acetyltransferase [Geminicoccaceae bacterium]|nr:MAG: GNAT family N-acetyltransferase [Geminicoccaceae bacterium]
MQPPRVIQDRAGRTYRLRPIELADAPALQRALQRMDPRDVRARLFAPTTTMSDEAARRFCTIDPAHEMCLVIEDEAEPGVLLGGCRLMGDASGATAEFAVTLLSELKGRGLGRALMETLLAEAPQRGFMTVWGCILRDNRSMIELCRKLCFRIATDPDDPSVVKATWQRASS